jgi:hypothetical protein
MATSKETTSEIATPQDHQDPPDTTDGNTSMVAPLLPQESPDDSPGPLPDPTDITSPLSITGVILNRGNTGTNVLALHNQLLALGAVIAPSEKTAQLYGESTAVAVRAFRQQYGLPAGETLDLPTGRLMHAAAAFAGPGGRVALRAAVRAAAAAADTSQPQELYGLARYATLAGDYQTAHAIARRIPNHGGVKAVIEPILALPAQAEQPVLGQPLAASQPLAPELPYPENFYTYHHDFYPLDVLNDVQRQVAAVGEPPRSANQAYPDSGTVGARMIQAAVSWFEALKQWQIGNAAFNHQNYEAAQAAYDACQSAACDYFDKYHSIDMGTGPLTERLSNLIKHLASNEASWPHLWFKIFWRRNLLSLEELSAWDWPAQRPTLYIPRQYDPFHPHPPVGTLPLPPDYGLGFIQWYLRLGELGPVPETNLPRQNDLEAPLITLAFVLVPLARAEANRARRKFEAAVRDLRWVLDSIAVGQSGYARIACEFIELPFARLLLAETMLDQADAEYKARIAAAPPPAPDVAAYQGLKAAQTYLELKAQFTNEGEYVARVDASRAQLTEQIEQRLAANDTRSPAFQLLGKDILVPTITSTSATLPGLDRRAKAHEPLLKFTPPSGQPVMRETNPRVYAALLTATARLEQLKAGFNYLGYLDSYVPPWRFQFLLERARYFAEHAKNAQREYLNFLSNAEREEFQELSASQNVAMEKSNVRIETARIEQMQLEVAAVQQSVVAAELTATNAGKRLEASVGFHQRVREIEERSFLGSFAVSFGKFVVGAVTANPGMSVKAWADAAGQISEFNKQEDLRTAQHQLEEYNLSLTIEEANQAAAVARAQLAAATSGLVVAGLQRQAVLLRHEFALQNLEFLRRRVLSAEQWYRLAAAIRSVSEAYLRYSVELAFLAEQAYEFEADKRLNVIRFDYDLSEVGNFLAADFLLRDLDTLEQDLLVTQRQRQQQVRYVLSMAREFPEALQEIRERGKTTFSLRLEQIEKRFPGLYNVRIGAVDVLPVALLDSTRFSLELTHLGTSQVRLHAQPDTPPGTPSPSPLNTNELPIPTGGWLAELQEMWPIKLRVTGPETVVFSGLTRQDANTALPFATASQRNAFEGRGLAGDWQIDMSARDNQVVPESLADLLLTFTVSGYHDASLRAAIDAASPQTIALTSHLSARQVFPDAFYDFSRTGRMVWKVPREMLALNGDLGRLRNIGMSLRPTVPDVHYSRLMSRLRVQFRVNGSGEVANGVTLLTPIPETSVTQTAPLTVAVRAALDTASELAWDFGDGTPILRTVRSGTTPLAPAEGTHTYARPGRYLLKLRCVQNEVLAEFRISVVVSRSQKLGDPLIVTPHQVAFNTTTKAITFSAGGSVQQAGRMLWRVGDLTAEGNSASFTLKPGNYILDFSAVHKLNFKAYGAQRYVMDLAPLPLTGLSATTNRTFDQNGNETNGTGTPPLPARNELAERLFDKGPITPDDDWAFELIPQEILGVPAGTAIGREELDLSDIQDVVLSMEYDVTPGNGS